VDYFEQSPAFFINRIYMVVLGIVNTILVGIAGLYDFWRWEYNHGHNLSPDAPIKVPGMSYQPPLLGCKELLNITACSWPHIGGILLFIVLGILFWIWYNEYKHKES
jgi:copper chaperone NosL